MGLATSTRWRVPVATLLVVALAATSQIRLQDGRTYQEFFRIR